jgi:DNA-binding response OmpR family regulator
VPKTLLAVDDSVTMRKVLEIAFSEDFRVITAEGHQDALAKLSAPPSQGDAPYREGAQTGSGDEPKIFVIDTVLGDEDGYALSKEIRRRAPASTIILLSSRHAQYDQAKGKDAGADDFMDKPFDTQQLIDKVKKVIMAKEGPEKTAPAAPSKLAAAAAIAPLQQRGTQPSLGGAAAGTRQRAATLMFGHEPAGGDGKHADAPAAHAAPVAAKTVEKAAVAAPGPAVTPGSNTPPSTVAATPAALHGVNGHLGPKLEALGLTPAQADAVLALSREVVEKVVWEVVPVVAEALIKEEIARLTKEG